MTNFDTAREHVEVEVWAVLTKGGEPLSYWSSAANAQCAALRGGDTLRVVHLTGNYER